LSGGAPTAVLGPEWLETGETASAPAVAQATGSTPGGTEQMSASSPSSPAQQAVELASGTVFAGRYEILGLIGRGGMGSVYSVRDRELDKVIALKTIRSAGEVDSVAIQRFKQELVLARRITHKNVVRIYDLGEAGGLKFFSMELIEGENLKELIRRQGRIPSSQAGPLARQILAALQEAHEQGVVHRDLKPQNVMVDKAGAPHLMDFGIARGADSEGMTATGAIVGTPDYMSPEQVRGEKADRRSDIFSFGVILYEMLTGDVPYQGETPISKIVMRLTHKPRAPRELSADIPRYLEAVVLKCMELDPVLRYQSVAEILADLDREQVGRSLTLRMQRAAQRGASTYLAVGVAVFALGGGGYWFSRTRATPAAIPEGPVHMLAIVPFTNATGAKELEWMRTGLPEMLVTDLSQSQYVRPVPGERVHRVLQDAGLASQARFDEAALESVSKLAHAQSVLSGQFVESGGTLRLDLTLRKAGSGVSVPLKVEGAPSEVFALVDRISTLIKEQLDLSPAQIRRDADRPIAEVATASLEAQRAYQAGLAQLRLGANQDAVLLLREATAEDPSFAMAYAKLAQAHLNAGQHEEAGAATERATALAEKAALPVAERYQIHATAALAKDDYETAARSYGELAKLYPEDPDVQLSLARALEELGKQGEALTAYRRVVELAPGYGAALLGLGRTQVLTGHADQAIRSLQDALATKQFEGEPEALGMIHSILGVAYRNTSQLERAVEELDRSLAYRVEAGDKRGQAVTLYNLASVYEYRGEIDRALAAERKALALARELQDRAEESVALNNMGLTYKVAGKLDKALSSFRESLQIEMERQDHRALANRLNKIGDVYRLMGRYDDAVVYLEQAKAHTAQSGEVEEQAINLNYIGQVRKAQGLYDQALEAYLAALPLYTQIDQQMGVAMTHHDLAEIYAAQGRYADARGAIQQSVEIYEHLEVVHDIAEARAPLGHLLATLGQVDEADRELKEAERLAGEAKAEGIMPEILLGRAEVAHLRGQGEQAAALFEQANVKANLSGQKEVAVESRIELGRLYLEQGRLANAERLLRRTRDEAAQARLRPLEAAAGAALAEVLLKKGDAEAARREAQDAIRLAERFSGRPVIFAGQATLGLCLDALGRGQEAVDAYAKAAATLEWMRGSLRPEHSEPFMARHDVQDFLRGALVKLEAGGRAAEAAPLRKWAGVGPARASR
jgi:tetratricopeptide (TPR) repeat protein